MHNAQRTMHPEQSHIPGLTVIVQHEHILNPLTALAFYRGATGTLLILAGEGPFLKVFDAETSRLLSQCEIFCGQTIHGIVVKQTETREDDLLVVLWGGSSLVLLKKIEFELLLTQDVSSIADTAIQASDWILDIAISPFEDVSCVLITAHNTVLRARLRQGSGADAVVIDMLHSPSRSILYSAHLAWESASCVIVAAGTVFGEIVVWKCFFSGQMPLQTSYVLFTFTGHEGSIFGVDISPPISIPGVGVARLLASCSDDRTIRVWNLAADSTMDNLLGGLIIARETGFGNNNDDPKITSAEDRCVAMVMGHASRIWRVKFFVDEPCSLGNSFISILSFGEDATTQQWALEIGRVSELGLGSTFRLSQMNIFAFHSGKHVWSTATNRIDHSSAMLATGGADSKISLYKLTTSSTVSAGPMASPNSSCSNPGNTEDEYSRSSSWELDKVLKSCLIGIPGIEPLVEEAPNDIQLGKPDNSGEEKFAKEKTKRVLKDAFNRYAFVSETQMLVTTILGQVFLAHIDGALTWKKLRLPRSAMEDLKSYTVVKGFLEMNLACLAGANGKIYAYKSGSAFLSQVGSVSGKVADMFKIFNTETKSFELLVTTLGGTHATLFNILDSPSEPPQLSQTSVYKLPERFVVTSAGRIKDLMVLGSRSGTLALFDPHMPEASINLWSPNGGGAVDALTTIMPLAAPVEEHISGSSYFLATGRNGTYSIFKSTIIRSSDMAITTATVHPVHHGTPPFGPMIEAAWFDGTGLILYGFRGKNFIVWNETKQYEITNVECGGAHRSYDYSPIRGAHGAGHFVYTKASRLYVHSQCRTSHSVVKSGGHGREIKTCSVSPDGSLIATGAEDTGIRIWHYDARKPAVTDHLICQAVIQKHSAGIQHLHWHGSNYLFSSGGNEELFIWAAEKVPTFGIGVVCEATCPNQSSDRDLRIMSLDVTDIQLPLGSQTEAGMLISLAYSDSTIRTHTYSKHSGFNLVASGRYTSACLMQIRHIKASDEVLLLTAATDGRLAVWKGASSGFSQSTAKPAQLVMVSSIKVHQSSIKTLDIIGCGDRIVVTTGGDDNALCVTIYSVSNISMPSAAPENLILLSAHAAAITGLCFVPATNMNAAQTLRIVSSSNDQRVREWNVLLEEEAIKMVGDVFTSVADVSDLAVLRVGENCETDSTKILVVGNGMEIFDLSC
jgi:WD repeat-containing protein 6